MTKEERLAINKKLLDYGYRNLGKEVFECWDTLQELAKLSNRPESSVALGSRVNSMMHALSQSRGYILWKESEREELRNE